MTKVTTYILVCAAILGIVLIGFFGYKKYHGTPTGTDLGGVVNSTTTTSADGTQISGIPEGATVQIEDRLDAQAYDHTPKPSLNRTFPQGTFTVNEYALLKKQRDTLTSAITTNPPIMSNWISLGILHKQVGDYEGARIYWTYVATVSPQNIAAHWDLASLYELYIKDRNAAQQQFAKVIALDKTYVSAYIESANTYVDAGDTANALSILGKGIVANTGSTDLLIARAHLYRSLKNTSSAKADYNAAITLASKAGNSTLAAELTDEMNAL